MTLKRKLMMVTALVLALLTLAACAGEPAKEVEDMSQKTISVTNKYTENDPSKLSIPDYRALALGYDELLTSKNLTVKDVPLTWWDETHQMQGICSYAGGNAVDGAQEGLTQISAVLSAACLGLDETDRDGVNYAEMLHGYFNEEEKVVANNPGGSSVNCSMWYLLYPAMQFVRVSMYYPQEEQLRQDALDTIESWYQAGCIMEKTGTFEYTGFDFAKMEPWKNGIWIEPDCAAGIAQLMDYGWKLTGNGDYAALAQRCLQYCDDYYGSSLYEVCLYSVPYLAAQSNALNGTSYSLDNLFGDIFDGGSIPRGGWGQITGVWGDYEVDGLLGSITDRKGYAFSMNTFAAAYAISPVAKYDTRYAVSLGKWYLKMAVNSQNFFWDYVDRENTSEAEDHSLDEAIADGLSNVAFEGIRHSHDSKTPWIGGDALESGWAQTDFSMYSGSHTGMFASILKQTDVAGILMVDCTAADLGTEQWQTWLVYNPYDKDKSVTYEVNGTDPVDLYDSVSNTWLARNVNGSARITIPAGGACVVTELPAGTELTRQGTALMADGKFVSADTATVWVNSPAHNEKVPAKVTLDVGVALKNPEDGVETVTVSCGTWSETFHAAGELKLDLSQLGSGSKTLEITLTTKNGLTDTTSIRIKVE